jgi:hypothetical protein
MKNLKVIILSKQRYRPEADILLVSKDDILKDEETVFKSYESKKVLDLVKRLKN